MIFAGLLPFILGFIFSIFIRKTNTFNKRTTYLYNTFLAILTIWMYLNGILEIYGTTNPLLNYYIYAALFFLMLTILNIIFSKN